MMEHIGRIDFGSGFLGMVDLEQHQWIPEPPTGYYLGH